MKYTVSEGDMLTSLDTDLKTEQADLSLFERSSMCDQHFGELYTISPKEFHIVHEVNVIGSSLLNGKTSVFVIYKRRSSESHHDYILIKFGDIIFWRKLSGLLLVKLVSSAKRQNLSMMIRPEISISCLWSSPGPFYQLWSPFCTLLIPSIVD